MVRNFQTLGALVLTIVAGVAAAQGIPNLSGYDSETQQSMELACVSDKVKGPAPYGACLNKQIASLQNSPGIPSLSGYDSETQQSMELACVSDKVKGPAPYGACLNKQIASLQQAFGKTSSQSPSKPSAPQSQRASNKQPSQSSSQANTTRPQLAQTRPPKSAPTVESALWYDVIPLVILLALLIALLTPTLWVLFSSRSHGGAKFGWFIIALCFSWLGLAAFLILTQAPRKRPN